MQTRSLTGITWNHTRGNLPLVAAAQRFADRRDGGDQRRTLADMNRHYRESRADERA